MVLELETSFMIPVINGDIYLGRRVKEPYKEYWSAIGGKAEPRILPYSQLPWSRPCIREKMGGHKVISRMDEDRLRKGKEVLFETAARELCEEIFPHKKYPGDFKAGDIAHFYNLNFIRDNVVVNGQEIEADNYFVIA